MKLETPICIASGPWGLPEGLDVSCVGAWTAKTVTPAPHEGNSGEVLREIDGGYINRLGLPNKGIKAFLEDYTFNNVPTFVSLYGFTPEELLYWSPKIAGLQGVIGVELNESCPNVDGEDFNLTLLFEEVFAVKRDTSLKVTVKLPPLPLLLREVIPQLDTVDGFVLTNSMPGMVDGMWGGMSGKCLKPISVGCVNEASMLTDLPIIGCGGITTGRDVKEYLDAGASYVQVGSIQLKEPDATTRIAAEYLDLTPD